MIQVSDVLDFLVARTGAPSTMGAQLDRLRYGIQIEPDPFRARREAEDHILQQAGLIRCVDDFSARREFTVSPRKRSDSTAAYKILDKFQKATRRGQGSIAIGILRAYHEWCTGVNNQERGLLAVYMFLGSLAPESVPPPPKEEMDLLQAFRVGTAKRARSMACEAYADALLALQRHIQVWNKRQAG